MVPFSVETEEKHFLKKTGRKFTFGIKDLAGDDEGLYQVMVEGVLIFSTDFKGGMSSIYSLFNNFPFHIG